MKATKLLAGIGLAAATLSLAACGGSSSSPSGAPAKGGTSASASGAAKGATSLAGQTLTFAFSGPASADETTADYALQILKKEGVTVHTEFLGGDVVSAKAVVAGRVNVASTSLAPGISGKLTTIGVDEGVPDYAIVGAPSVKTAQDMIGKTYGVFSTGGIDYALASAVLAHFHIKPSQVTFLSMGVSPSARAAALVSGRIQITDLHSDQWIQLQNKGYNLLATGAQVDPEIDGALEANPSWVQSHHALAVAVSAAFMEAAKWAYANKSAWVQLATKFVPKLSTANASKLYGAYSHERLWKAQGPTQSMLQFTEQKAVDSKELKASVPVSQFADLSLIQAAKAQAAASSQ